MSAPLRLNIFGTGRAARALVATVQERAAGAVTLGALISRNPDAHPDGSCMGVPVVASDAGSVVGDADLLLLAIPDDAIDDSLGALASMNTPATIVHLSGARGPVRAGALTAWPFHPLLALSGARPLPVHSAVFVAPDAPAPLAHLAGALKLRQVTLPEQARPAYHLAAVLASNHALTLFADARTLLEQAGISRADAHPALTALLGSVVDNLRTARVDGELPYTGPVVRGDVQTISAHLNAIQDEELADVYRALTRRLAHQLGTESARKVLSALED